MRSLVSRFTSSGATAESAPTTGLGGVTDADISGDRATSSNGGTSSTTPQRRRRHSTGGQAMTPSASVMTPTAPGGAAPPEDGQRHLSPSGRASALLIRTTPTKLRNLLGSFRKSLDSPSQPTGKRGSANKILSQRFRNSSLAGLLHLGGSPGRRGSSNRRRGASEADHVNDDGTSHNSTPEDGDHDLPPGRGQEGGANRNNRRGGRGATSRARSPSRGPANQQSSGGILNIYSDLETQTDQESGTDANGNKGGGILATTGTAGGVVGAQLSKLSKRRSRSKLMDDELDDFQPATSDSDDEDDRIVDFDEDPDQVQDEDDDDEAAAEEEPPYVPVEMWQLPLYHLAEFLDLREAVNLALTCKEFYEQRRVAHLRLAPNLVTKEQFDKWMPLQMRGNVTSLCLTNLVMDVRPFAQLRHFKINLDMSKKLRKNIQPEVTTDALFRWLNLGQLEELCVDSLTTLPDLTLAYNLKHLFLAFRADHGRTPISFKCGSTKLRSIQLASCNLGHGTSNEFPPLSAGDICAVISQLERPDRLLHLRLRRIKLVDNVKDLCDLVASECVNIRMFTFTTQPLILSFQDMLRLRLGLGLVAFSARSNGAATSDTWPNFWPTMKYFWPRGANSITPFTVFSTDFAFDELGIVAEEEWGRLTPAQLLRYCDITEEVKRVYAKAYPTKRSIVVGKCLHLLRKLYSGVGEIADRAGSHSPGLSAIGAGLFPLGGGGGGLGSSAASSHGGRSASGSPVRGGLGSLLAAAQQSQLLTSPSQQPRRGESARGAGGSQGQQPILFSNNYRGGLYAPADEPGRLQHFANYSTVRTRRTEGASGRGSSPGQQLAQMDDSVNEQDTPPMSCFWASARSRSPSLSRANANGAGNNGVENLAANHDSSPRPEEQQRGALALSFVQDGIPAGGGEIGERVDPGSLALLPLSSAANADRYCGTGRADEDDYFDVEPGSPASPSRGLLSSAGALRTEIYRNLVRAAAMPDESDSDIEFLKMEEQRLLQDPRFSHARNLLLGSSNHSTNGPPYSFSASQLSPVSYVEAVVPPEQAQQQLSEDEGAFSRLAQSKEVEEAEHQAVASPIRLPRHVEAQRLTSNTAANEHEVKYDIDQSIRDFLIGADRTTASSEATVGRGSDNINCDGLRPDEALQAPPTGSSAASGASSSAISSTSSATVSETSSSSSRSSRYTLNREEAALNEMLFDSSSRIFAARPHLALAGASTLNAGPLRPAGGGSGATRATESRSMNPYPVVHLDRPATTSTAPLLLSLGSSPTVAPMLTPATPVGGSESLALGSPVLQYYAEKEDEEGVGVSASSPSNYSTPPGDVAVVEPPGIVPEAVRSTTHAHAPGGPGTSSSSTKKYSLLVSPSPLAGGTSSSRTSMSSSSAAPPELTPTAYADGFIRAHEFDHEPRVPTPSSSSVASSARSRRVAPELLRDLDHDHQAGAESDADDLLQVPDEAYPRPVSVMRTASSGTRVGSMDDDDDEHDWLSSLSD